MARSFGVTLGSKSIGVQNSSTSLFRLGSLELVKPESKQEQTVVRAAVDVGADAGVSASRLSS